MGADKVQHFELEFDPEWKDFDNWSKALSKEIATPLAHLEKVLHFAVAWQVVEVDQKRAPVQAWSVIGQSSWKPKVKDLLAHPKKFYIAGAVVRLAHALIVLAVTIKQIAGKTKANQASATSANNSSSTTSSDDKPRPRPTQS